MQHFVVKLINCRDIKSTVSFSQLFPKPKYNVSQTHLNLRKIQTGVAVGFLRVFIIKICLFNRNNDHDKLTPSTFTKHIRTLQEKKLTLYNMGRKKDFTVNFSHKGYASLPVKSGKNRYSHWAVHQGAAANIYSGFPVAG